MKALSAAFKKSFIVSYFFVYLRVAVNNLGGLCHISHSGRLIDEGISRLTKSGASCSEEF